MGHDSTMPDGSPSNTAPAHTVHVATFTIAVTPVSVHEFARFVESTGYRTTAERAGASWVWHGDPTVRVPGQDHLWSATAGACWAHPRGPDSDVQLKPDHPVTHVSREDCLAYGAWAGCRLPTEAEWELAARGCDGRAYTWGNDPPEPSMCNYNMHVGDTTPVGSYPKSVSPFGLHDMAGNVWEWMANPWHRYPFGQSRPPTIQTRQGTSQLGVIRGGSFFNDFTDGGLLAYERVYGLPDYSSYDVGFRVCRD